MEVNLRQGLIIPRNRSTFLTRSNESINLIVENTIRIIFAHGDATYLFEELETVNEAWPGPFSNIQSYWFYWDVSLETGQLSRGITQVEPSFGTTLPLSPVVDQHFFDKTDNFMKVWDGAVWVQKIRVFAGSLINGAITSLNAGSQVDIYGPTRAADLRFYKLRAPIRRELEDGNFEFITNTGDPRVDVGSIENFKLGRVDLSVVASETIAKNTVVLLDDNGELAIASSSNATKEALGIIEVNVVAGDKKNVITRGYIKDRNWSFQEPPLTPLYVGLNGEITPTIPTSTSLQKVGFVVGPDIIFVDIDPQIGIIGTPTPTPTASVTPTVTPTPSITPDVSANVTPTVTPTATVTPTVTPTFTATATVTPTVTPTASVTPGVSVTPTQTTTVTPTPTVTPTLTVTPSPTALPGFSAFVNSFAPVVWYNFTETSGDIINQGTAGANHNLPGNAGGTYNVNGQGQTGGAFSLNGTSGFRNLSDGISTDGSDNGTFFIAFTHGTGRLLNLFEGFDGDDIVINMTATSVAFAFSGPGFNDDATGVLDTPPALNDGNFHTVMYRKPSGANPEIFIDGVLQSVTYNTAGGGDPTRWINEFGGDDIAIGQRGNPEQQFFNGIVDEFIYFEGQQLTNLEIAQINSTYFAQ